MPNSGNILFLFGALCGGIVGAITVYSYMKERVEELRKQLEEKADG